MWLQSLISHYPNFSCTGSYFRYQIFLVSGSDTFFGTTPKKEEISGNSHFFLNQIFPIPVPAPKKNPGIGNSRDWGTWPVIILRIRLLPPAPCSLDSEDLARAWQARWRFLFSRSRQYSEPGLGQRCSSHCVLLLWQQGLPPTYQKVIVIMVIASPMYLGCPGTLLVFEGHPTNCKCVTSLALPRISTRENFLGRKKHLGFWQFFNTLKCSHSWCFSILEKGRTGFLISVASVASISQPRVSFHLVFQSLSASQWLTP